MGAPYAVGKHAFGFCDRCGFRYPLHELNTEVINLEVVNYRVCPTCWDPMNPQTTLGRRTFNDPQALRNPRPPLGLTQSRFGDAIRYDFLTDDDSWTGTQAAIAYQSANQSILVTNSAVVGTHTVDRADLSVTTASADPDVDVYNDVRVLLELKTAPVAGDWVGNMTWNSGAGSKVINSPDFSAMGARRHVITWDMFQNSDWSDVTTVTQLSLEFFGNTNTEYEIYYIRFEIHSNDKLFLLKSRKIQSMQRAILQNHLSLSLVCPYHHLNQLKLKLAYSILH